MNISVDGIDISKYIQASGFSEGYEKVYDTSNSFIAADGTEHKPLKGIRKTYRISLYAVPVNVKNRLRLKSGKTMFPASIDGQQGEYFLDNFSASVIIQRENISLWQVSFELVSAALDTSGVPEEEIYDYGVRMYLDNAQYIELTTVNGAIDGDIQISMKASGIPVSGICGEQLTFTVNKNCEAYMEPPVNAVCYVLGFAVPVFYVTARVHSNDKVTFTCGDRTIYLDLPFDSVFFENLARQRKESDPDDENAELFDTSTVVQELALQSGFSGFRGFRIDRTVMPNIWLSDISNKSCRNILDTVSASACGVFCDDSGYLGFVPFGDIEAILPMYLTPAQRTEVVVGTPKGPIEGIYGINNDSGSDTDGKYKEYIAGVTFNPYTTIKVTSKYVNGTLVDALFSQCGYYTFRGFTVEHCFITSFLKIGTPLYFTEDPTLDPNEVFTVSGFDVHLSVTGAYASLSADSVSEEEWDFTGAISRQVEQRIEEGRKYYGVSLTSKNGLVCETKDNDVKGKVSLKSKGGLECTGVAGKVSMENGTIYFYDNMKDKQGNTSTGGA